MGLQADVSNVTAHISDSEVELECEMTLYIRPDEDLQWFRGSENITSETNRYTILYRNGLAGAAQNGGNVTTPGRVSVLAISNPQLSDSGKYTCRILGTEQSADIQLTVESVTPPPSVTMTATSVQSVTPPPSVTMTATSVQSVTPMGPSTTLSTEIIAIVIIIGFIFLATIFIAAIIIAVFAKRKKGLKTDTNVACGVNSHHLEITTPSNAQTTSTDYYVNESLGPNQPTCEEEYYSYPLPGPHVE